MTDQEPQKGDTARITVKGIGTFEVPSGLNLREALRSEGVYIDGTCSDNGTCGRCVVLVVDGDAGEPSAQEAGLLGERSTGGASRLACRITVKGDLDISVDAQRLLEIDRSGRWKEVSGAGLWHPGQVEQLKEGFGVAVDLGTTAIVSCLYDLSLGKLLDIRSSVNPQVPWGEDIISRLDAASRDRAAGLDLSESVWSTIRDQIRSLCLRTGVSGGRVVRMVVVANSAMHHLSLGLPVEKLLIPPYSPADGSPRVLGPKDLPVNLPIGSSANIYFPGLIGGYAGSDALVSVMAARKYGAQSGALLDVGTNTEIAVWKGEAIVMSTAPSGPAFEGGRISRGMSAREGAVWKVSAAGDNLAWEVIGGGKPEGICGTGMVDALAVMLRLGLIDRTGLLVPGSHPLVREGAFVLDGASGTGLNGEDIAELQKAKSAIAATFQVTLKALSIKTEDLDAVYLAGSFGSRLNIDSAVATGLLPALPGDRFTLAGNTALVGASMLLFSDEEQENLEALSSSIKHHDVAQDVDFEEMFIDNLYFPQA